MRTLPVSLEAVDTIVVLTEYPLTARDYERFGLPVFLDQGLRVEVWDVSLMVRQHTEVPPLDMPLRRMGSLADFRSALAGLAAPRTLIVSFLAYDMKTLFFFRAISKVGIPYAVGQYASMSRKSYWGFSLRRLVSSLSPRQLMDHFFARLDPTWLGIKPPRLVLAAGGSETCAVVRYPIETTEVVRGHTHDYDLYLRCREHAAGTVQRTAVFLDEYMPFHPDYQRLGIRPYATAEQYFPQLNRFFDTLEQRLGLRVFIAAHPRSRYEEHGNLFLGRTVVKGRTVELVRDADLVLLHASTAVNFVALFKKPMVFLTSDALDSSNWGGYIQSMAEQFGKTPINVDCSTPNTFYNSIFDIDFTLYEQFIDRHIKTKGTTDKPCWQFLTDHIKDDRADQP